VAISLYSLWPKTCTNHLNKKEHIICTKFRGSLELLNRIYKNAVLYFGLVYIQNMSSTAGNDNNDQHGGSGEVLSSKKECTPCEQNSINNIIEGINSMGVSDMSTCANCGKEGNSVDMNICNKCKMVKYCNAACKKRSTDQNIKRHVKNEWLSCMTKLYLRK
jgi:hypothetical protein